MEVLNSFMTWIFKNRLGQIENFKENPLEVQHEIFLDLIEAGKRTKFGKERRFSRTRHDQKFQRTFHRICAGHRHDIRCHHVPRKCQRDILIRPRLGENGWYLRHMSLVFSV